MFAQYNEIINGIRNGEAYEDRFYFSGQGAQYVEWVREL